MKSKIEVESEAKYIVRRPWGDSWQYLDYSVEGCYVGKDINSAVIFDDIEDAEEERDSMPGDNTWEVVKQLFI